MWDSIKNFWKSLLKFISSFNVTNIIPFISNSKQVKEKQPASSNKKTQGILITKGKGEGEDAPTVLPNEYNKPQQTPFDFSAGGKSDFGPESDEIELGSPYLVEIREEEKPKVTTPEHLIPPGGKSPFAFGADEEEEEKAEHPTPSSMIGGGLSDRLNRSL